MHICVGPVQSTALLETALADARVVAAVPADPQSNKLQSQFRLLCSCLTADQRAIVSPSMMAIKLPLNRLFDQTFTRCSALSCLTLRSPQAYRALRPRPHCGTPTLSHKFRTAPMADSRTEGSSTAQYLLVDERGVRSTEENAEAWLLRSPRGPNADAAECR